MVLAVVGLVMPAKMNVALVVVEGVTPVALVYW